MNRFTTYMRFAHQSGLMQNESLAKETPVLPPEHPVTKPETKPEKEKNTPFHPAPEITPVRKPEINPEKK